MTFDDLPDFKEKAEAFHEAGKALIEAIDTYGNHGISLLDLQTRAFVVGATDGVGEALNR